MGDKEDSELTFPISRHGAGEWEFVEEFKGTEQEFADHIQNLQKADLSKQYRCWDCR